MRLNELPRKPVGACGEFVPGPEVGTMHAAVNGTADPRYKPGDSWQYDAGGRCWSNEWQEQSGDDSTCHSLPVSFNHQQQSCNGVEGAVRDDLCLRRPRSRYPWRNGNMASGIKVSRSPRQQEYPYWRHSRSQWEPTQNTSCARTMRLTWTPQSFPTECLSRFPPDCSHTRHSAQRRNGYESDDGILDGILSGDWSSRSKVPALLGHLAAVNQTTNGDAVPNTNGHVPGSPPEIPPRARSPRKVPVAHRLSAWEGGMGLRDSVWCQQVQSPQPSTSPESPTNGSSPPVRPPALASRSRSRPGRPSHTRVVLGRSRSTPNLEQPDDDTTDASLSNHDDEDGDDFGFLSHPGFQHVVTGGAAGSVRPASSVNPSLSPVPGVNHSSVSPLASVMQKAKSPSQARRLLLKKWKKSKPESSPGLAAGKYEAWGPQVGQQHVTAFVVIQTINK